MEDMEQKLNSILGNPEMMAQIMNMAQAMGASQSPPTQQPAPPPKASPTPLPPTGFDPVMLQKIAGIAQQSGIDRNQQGLLKALRPYLNEERIVKLEKAMRAAKIAGIASSALGGASSLFFPGR